MLSTTKINNIFEQFQYFNNFKIDEQLWIVSDLKSKQSFQNKILEKQNFIIGEPIFRMSEFLKNYYLQNFPDFQLCDETLLKTISVQYLESIENINFEKNQIDLAFDFLNKFIMLISSEEAYARVNQWLMLENNKNYLFQTHLQLARLIYLNLFSQKLSSYKWIAAELFHSNKYQFNKINKIYFNLGGDINQIEAEVIIQISKYIDVEVLMPNPIDEKKFSDLSLIYKQIIGYSSNKITENRITSNAEQDICSRKYYEFNTVLGEIKWVISKIRELLETNQIQINQILLASPHIEYYWPVLRKYLEIEGIPSDKELKLRLHSLLSMQSFISKLSIKNNNINTSFFEKILFNNKKTNISYRIFEKFGTNIYNVNNIFEFDEVKEVIGNLKHDLLSNDKINRDQFVLYCIGLWSCTESEDAFVNLIKKFIEQTPKEILMSLKEWSEYIIDCIFKIEINLGNSHKNSLKILPLKSFEQNEIKIIFFIGCNEDFINTQQNFPIQKSYINKIKSDLGFPIIDENFSRNLFDLTYSFNNHDIEMYYSFSNRGLQGEALNKLNYFIERSVDFEFINLFDTRWDSIMLYHQLNAINGQYEDESIEQRINIDRRTLHNQLHLSDKINKISPSSLEKYLDCPFKYTATQYFKLKDEPALDIQVDPLTVGSIYHKLFEEILDKSRVNDISHEEILAIVETVIIQYKKSFINENLFNIFKEKLFNTGIRFYEFEKQWFQFIDKPNAQYVEKSFRFNQSVIIENNRKVEFEFLGKIDRIDQFQGSEIAIIDYKSTTSGFTGYSSWIKNNKIQLLFYSWVLKNNYIPEIKGDIFSAALYSIKTINREKGFYLDEYEDKFYPNFGRKRNKIDKDSLNQLISDFELLLKNTLGRIVVGEYLPLPHDKDECKKCKWKKLCRAPHLN